MNVLLINPLNNAWSSGTVSLPLGLAYLASSLEKAGHKVTCVDMNLEKNHNIEEDIKQNDIIGITACTPVIKKAWSIAEIAKKHGKKVILGGPHPTVLPEESLNTGFVDIVVRGEGEETFNEICGNADILDINGISYKENNKNINNPARERIKDLDKLPFPARHLFKFKSYSSEFHRKKVVANIITSRGCPCLCNFCSRSVFGNNYVMRGSKNVVDEWESMINMGIEEIGINDDNFSAVPSRAIEICNMIIQRGLIVPWAASGGLRVDKVNKELLQAMKKSGCYRASLGAESGSQEILDRTGKKIKVQQIRDAVKLCKEAGLETLTFFMIGNLGETEDSINMTINLAKELNPDFVQFTVAVPYPGTDMYDEIKKNGKLLVNDWDDFGSYTGKSYYEYGGVSGRLVEKMFKKAYRDYYLRPGIALKMLYRYNFKIFKGLNLIR